MTRAFALAFALATSSCSRGDGAASSAPAPQQTVEITASAPVPNGARLEPSGHITILEAPLPAPFTTLASAELKPQPSSARTPELAHPAVPADLRAFVRAFPQAERPNGEVLDLGSQHVIVLRDGCFFLDRDGADDPLVHFPLHVGLTVDGEGYLAFRSRYKGQQDIVRVGLPAETGWFTDPFPARADAAAHCGAATMVGVTLVSNPYAGTDRFLPVLRRFRDRQGLTDDQAVARANACARREAQIAADRRLRGGREEPPDCRMY